MEFLTEIYQLFIRDWEIWLLVISVAIFGLTVLMLSIVSLSEKSRLTFNGKLLIFTISLTVSMWLLQYIADTQNPDFSETTLYERLALSFYHTLKAFGADDNFLVGIEYIEKTIVDTWLRSFYRGYAIILGFIAPITSAAVFFEILANVFPKIRLLFWRICLLKKKYYFSELNERSLALAKSILNTEKGIAPVIIFTDVYADKSQENTAELLAEAKRIGAICLRDDIIHIQKQGFGERKYFLIDNNEIANLQTYVKFTDKSNYKSLKKSEVYLFCQDYIYTDIEKQVRQKLEENEKSVDDFVVIPVRCYRNLITNMLEKTPIYEPVVHQKNKNSDSEINLNVTILGIGDIGTEMFLTTYWMGQMLNCKLNINVVSKESEADFWGKIDYINPEIRHTTQEEHEILRVYKNKEEFSGPYCNVKYFSCDIQSDEFRKLLEGEDGCNIILDTHYFLISLGSDQANLSVANTLKNRIGKYHIQNKEQNDKTIINYVVYNATLSETLNTNKFVCSYDNSRPDIYMQAVGGVEQIYTAKNIFMMDYYDSAKSAAKSYDRKQGKELRKKAYNKRLKSEYEYWSNLALSLHFKYKVFSANLIDHSIFDEESEYIRSTKSAFDTYKKMARRQLNKVYTIEQEMEFQHNMQWLEHRRWCAFLRTMGFRNTKDYKTYLKATKSHKQMDMKLHPCLVECDNKGIRGVLNEQGRVVDSLITKDSDGNIVKINAINEDVLNFDMLDQLTYDLAKLKQKDSQNGTQELTEFDPYDFKQYDYPNNDYLDNI